MKNLKIPLTPESIIMAEYASDKQWKAYKKKFVIKDDEAQKRFNKTFGKKRGQKYEK